MQMGWCDSFTSLRDGGHNSIEIKRLPSVVENHLAKEVPDLPVKGRGFIQVARVGPI